MTWWCIQIKRENKKKEDFIFISVLLRAETKFYYGMEIQGGEISSAAGHENETIISRSRTKKKKRREKWLGSSGSAKLVPLGDISSFLQENCDAESEFFIFWDLCERASF